MATRFCSACGAPFRPTHSGEREEALCAKCRPAEGPAAHVEITLACDGCGERFSSDAPQCPDCGTYRRVPPVSSSGTPKAWALRAAAGMVARDERRPARRPGKIGMPPVASLGLGGGVGAALVGGTLLVLGLADGWWIGMGAVLLAAGIGAILGSRRKTRQP